MAVFRVDWKVKITKLSPNRRDKALMMTTQKYVIILPVHHPLVSHAQQSKESCFLSYILYIFFYLEFSRNLTRVVAQGAYSHNHKFAGSSHVTNQNGTNESRKSSVKALLL